MLQNNFWVQFYALLLILRYECSLTYQTFRRTSSFLATLSLKIYFGLRC